ncbi:MAG: hypothetical protein AAF944_04625 [Bacteroidota bacterium]
MEGYFQHRQEDMRQSWEQTRTIAYTNVLPWMGKRAHGMTPEKFLPLSWDGEIPPAKKKEANQQELANWLMSMTDKENSDPEAVKEAEQFLLGLDAMTEDE